jgi:YggT family protein
MTQALYFIVKTLSQLVLLLYLLRLWLPLVHADFRNPIAQGVLRLTSPLIVPVRRFVPSVGRLDTAVILVVYLIQVLILILLMTIAQREIIALHLALRSVLELCMLSLNLFFFAIMIRIILSWIAPNTYNPVSAIASNLAEPILRPFRGLIPALGGLDLSPIFAIVMLKASEIYLQSLIPYINQL